MKKTNSKTRLFTYTPLKKIVISLFLSIALTACGGDSGDDSAPSTDKLPAETSKCLGAEIDETTSCIEVSNRKAILYKSDDKPKDGVALFLHGAPGSANKVMGIFDAKMLANEHNLVTLSPKGIENTWGWSSVNTTSTSANSDVDYINELLTKVRSEHNINSDKLYVFGYSAGGFMAYKLACAMPEQISAVVSLAGQFRGSLKACENSTPVAIHHFHSHSDQAVPYQGRNFGSIKSVEDTMELWREKNGCDIAVSSQKQIGVTTNSSTTTLTYDNCLATVALSQMAFVPHEADYIAENLYQIYQYIFDDKEL